MHKPEDRIFLDLDESEKRERLLHPGMVVETHQDGEELIVVLDEAGVSTCEGASIVFYFHRADRSLEFYRQPARITSIVERLPRLRGVLELTGDSISADSRGYSTVTLLARLRG